MDYWKFVIRDISHATYDLNNELKVSYPVLCILTRF